MNKESDMQFSIGKNPSIVSRADFLRLSRDVLVSGALFLNGVNFSSEKEDLPERILTFTKLGPFNLIEKTSGGSEGVRAVYSSPNNHDKIFAGTWRSGFFVTQDGGKEWTKVELARNPNSPYPAWFEQKYPQNTAREIVHLRDDSYLIVSDKGISVLQSNSSGNPKVSNASIDFEQLGDPSETNYRKQILSPQTAIVFDGWVIVSGYNATCRTRSSEVLSGNPNWSLVKMGTLDIQHFRTFSQSKKTGVIYAGGWIYPDKKGAGTGLYVSHDAGESFEKHPFWEQITQHIDAYESQRGMLINIIKTIEHEGHELVIIGGEGSGNHTRDGYDQRKPFLEILVDGELYAGDLNLNELALQLGTDMVSPGGMVVCHKTGELFLAGYAREIASASISEIVEGHLFTQRLNNRVKKINWIRRSRDDSGRRDFGAIELQISHDSWGAPYLIASGQTWEKPLRPVGVRRAKLANGVRKREKYI